MNKLILIIILVGSSMALLAQGPPITAETPIMLGLEGAGIRTFGKFISKENVKIYMQPIVIPYNITPKFQIGGIFPFKFITPINGETTSGFSDLTLFVKYQLYKKDQTAKTFRLLAQVKQSFPTGKTNSTPSIGSGIYQTYIGIIIGKISTGAGVYGDIGYNITSNNATDNISYNFSAGLPLMPQKYPPKQINTYLEFNGNYFIDTKVHTLFLSPGLQFIPSRRILFETSFQIPVLQQNLTPNKTYYMVLLGTRFLLN